MIQVAPGCKVHLALRPLRMRYGFDGLGAKVIEVLGGLLAALPWGAG